MERVKIKDIAQQLGVSTATVSNVIHGKTNKVSTQTIERVQKALEENQYIPSMAGILLAQNSSKIIGIFINDHEKYEGNVFNDFFISSSLNELSKEIEKHNFFMMIKKTKDPYDIVQFSSMWNLEGVIMIGFCEQDYHYLRNQIHIPLVIYDGFCEQSDRFVNIMIDDTDGGFQMGQYLALKHDKALCITDNLEDMDLNRYNGFQKGFQKEIHLFLVPMEKEKRWKYYEENFDHIQQATCAFALSDYYAIDFMHFLNEHHISIPDSMSVAGFDNTLLCEMVHPSLTTIEQNISSRARIAIQSILALKEGMKIQTQIQLPVKLIVRKSTK
ncbi:MAG: LacI family DNA-binding transcriptional regulator [Erysipelotrichaceae bacterium]|nr:LacI family transcriptional regulator [Erysipelotrichaceae bacterium]MDO4480093.1 LacI family DNA-binding transcriptional regulator [Erysipelotrichaceae bacterium]